jgi:flagellar basal-body rod protein FlgC
VRAIEISYSALDVEWRRLEVISQNLANANSAGSVKGASYRELNLVSGPRDNFSMYLNREDGTNPGIDVASLNGVAVRDIVASSAPPRLVHEPGNPLADAQGFVAYPAIDHALQMTKMIETARAYEANIVAMNIAREMYGKALEMGSQG